MWEGSVLLKIKRDFTESEAVQQLIKMVSELEIEIGILKSERHELTDELNKLKNSVEQDGLKTRKAWLKDELFDMLDSQMKAKDARNKIDKQSMEEWRNKYFSLLAKVGNGENVAINSLDAQNNQDLCTDGTHVWER